MHRRWICVLLAFLFALSLSGCREIWTTMVAIREVREDDIPSKEMIMQFVLDNEEKLLQTIQQSECETLEGYGIIESVYEADGYIDFSCGGSGFASQTDYAGFIYSPNGQVDVARSDVQMKNMIPEGNGYYWKQEEGDNTYYIENIIGNFYYYYEHY